MLKANQLFLQVHSFEQGAFFITVTNEDGVLLLPQQWKKHLFLWNSESFYGSVYKETTVDGLLGLRVSAYHMLTLLGREEFSQFFEWNWNDFGELLHGTSAPLVDALLKHQWLPSFDDGLIWRVPEIVWEEFDEDYWQQEVAPGTKLKEFARDWFHDSVTDYLHEDLKFRDVQERLRAMEESTLSNEDIERYFTPERWRQWLGIEESPEPFYLGLRLTEPEEEGEPWTLETILQNKKNAEKIYSLDRGDRLPPSWKPYLPHVEEERAKWADVMPSVSDRGALKMELDEEESWRFLTELSEKLVALGIKILLPAWWIAMKEANLTVKARVKNNDASYRPSFVGMNAILDYDWRVSVNGEELSEEDFKKLVDDQRRFVKVQGQWMTLDPATIRRIQELMNRAKEDGVRLQDLLNQELTRDEELEEEYDPKEYMKFQIEMNRSLKKMIGQLQDVSKIPLLEPSEGLQATLRPYQQLGMSWLYFLRRFGFGAVLADDMGLGKTIQLISYLLHVKEEEDVTGPALIIAPTSVLGNWQHEIERFAPSLKVRLHYGAIRLKGEAFAESVHGVDVVLTSYGLSYLDEEEISEVSWSTIALDEAQNIKNSGTKQSRTIRKLSGGHHIALTGTPMENRLSELWSIFDFVNKGYLGTNAAFQKDYIVPIEKEDNREKIRELQGRIRPFLLRRTKKDPEVELNLPEKLEQKEYCPLTAEQASLYEQLVQETFEKLKTLKGFERKGLILQMLGRLKQLCNHPSLYFKEEVPLDVLKRSYKMAKLHEIVENVVESKEACLVFTQYIGMGEMIQDYVKKQFGVHAPFLNGSMPKQQRDKLVQQFQNGEFPVFILSLKAGGTGLNLTAANHVVHYDRWWNPAVENQATDRAYRIGQTKFVHVHKLIASGTLEEKIDGMLEKKQALNDDIIQSDSWITEMNDRDLEELLTLG
ncbi:ATP-dependent helicase [Bacillus coahuilensis p1.1.43]|uniref:ATP-dependent helicase n=1 Tax=Bacillus coahuilensis p1.1.43 TaxID=1150625 RepID=A0A147K470_9BACI|nr:DEAD/DEAH box helicase [Bacillus coahuilensis]KUP04128.1 ATP-dependent helicase [Bacillus coahuilensis p1.1.43]